MVHGCGATFNGCALNESLLQGPDLTNTLLGVLLRFRQGRMAFGADIASMFFQDKLHPRDWDSLCFLWWQDGDLSQPPQDYQMMVDLFGAKSSPACANCALKRVAEDNATKASSEAVLVIKRAFYVDDCLKSVDSERAAMHLVAEVKSLLKSGGFNLTKFPAIAETF